MPKAIILAGGYGTRLKELGESVPKGLLPYQNTNLIQLVVNGLTKAGINDIALITNTKYASQYSNWIKSQNAPVTFLEDGTTSPDTRLGGLGDLMLAIDLLKWHDHDILVAPSDTYFEFSLTDFVTFINLHPNEFATIVRELPIESIKNRLGCAVITNDRITEFVEKPENPPSSFAAIPFYYYPASIHSLLRSYASQGNSVDAPGNFIPWLIKQNLPVRAFVATKATLDVGTPEDLNTLQNLR